MVSFRRNPIRLYQLNKICDKYNIKLLDTKSLTYNNAWLSGFFDYDGSIYLNFISDQIFITAPKGPPWRAATQKNKLLLDPAFGRFIWR